MSVKELTKITLTDSWREYKQHWKLLIERIFLVSNSLFGVLSFFNYAIADSIYNLLYPDKTALKGKPKKADDFQLCFEFG